MVFSARNVMLSLSPLPTLTRYSPGVLTLLAFKNSDVTEAHPTIESISESAVTKAMNHTKKEKQKVGLVK
jgi:hypothetical protein